MKKTLLFLVLCLTSVCMQGQRSSLILDLGYRTEFDYADWGIGAQYKYDLPHNLRIATDLLAYIPGEDYFGLDLGVNLQYHINVYKNLYCYPLLGVIMSNHSFSADPNRRNQSELGFNFGLGAEYYISKTNFVNLDFRYNLIDKDKPAWYKDYGLVRIGYGFKF
jgi:opacity protein-like surface antigen